MKTFVRKIAGLKKTGIGLLLSLLLGSIAAANPDNDTERTRNNQKENKSYSKSEQTNIKRELLSAEMYLVKSELMDILPEQPVRLEKWMTDPVNNGWEGIVNEPEIRVEEWMYDITSWKVN